MKDGELLESGRIEVAGLRRLAGDLLEASKPGEAVFLTLGTCLEEAISVIGRLTDGLRDLAASDGTDVQAAADGLRQAASQVVGLVAGMEQERQTLDRLAEASGGGVRVIAQLQHTIGEIGVLGMNAKIQLAQIPGVTDEFDKFTGEITRLASLASTDLQRLEKGQTEIFHLIDQARSGLAGFSETYGQALADVGAHLQRSLDLLDRHHLQNREAVERTVRRSADVAQLVGQAVISLQVNDMTRQRIEHVAEALEKGAHLLSDPPAGFDDETERQQLVAIICRLQAIHLVKTAEQFETEVERLLGNLGILAREASGMVKDQAALAGSEDGGSSLFETLSGQLREATALYGKVAEARAGTQSLIGAISEGVGRMISYVFAVHEIEADIRIMGLNATLRCSRLGNSGRALAVIAQELRQCAKRTQDLAKIVGSRLESLVAEAKSLEGGTDQDGAGGGDAAAVVAAMSSSLGLLMGVQETFEGRCREMAADAARAKGLLAGAASRTDIHGVLGHRLRDVGAVLLRMTASIGDGDDKALSAKALGLLNANYTMAAEKELHDLFINDGVPASSPVIASDDTDDFLF